MNISQTFQDFLENLKVDNADSISYKYKRITKALNRKFRDSHSETNYSLQVGSYGRHTAIKGISDLDMIYELPADLYQTYNSRSGNGQSALLQDVKNAIKETYSNTDIRGDGQVVVVSFSNYQVEVCPAFLQSDNSYKYPDSNNGGSWKITKPRQEIEAVRNMNIATNGNMRRLAKMCRAWKNKNGVKIGGLLIDTFCYNFLKENESHWETTYSNYHILVRDFFEYLKDLSKHQKYWHAPGSNQKVYKKGNFSAKAKKAYNKACEAIEKNENKTVYAIWRKVFGVQFPYPREVLECAQNYAANEEFIENVVPVDIRFSLTIECIATQKGFRDEILSLLPILKKNKKLKFFIRNTDVPEPYDVKWKVKNKGEIAKAKDMFRGQIMDDFGNRIRKENSNFGGEHYVECYVIKDNVCVARDRIDVPISRG